MKYQRQFLLLKICVLGGIGFVLAILAGSFLACFLYRWQTTDDFGDDIITDDPEEVEDHADMAVQEAEGQVSKEKAPLEGTESGGLKLYSTSSCLFVYHVYF